MDTRVINISPKTYYLTLYVYLRDIFKLCLYRLSLVCKAPEDQEILNFSFTSTLTPLTRPSPPQKKTYFFWNFYKNFTSPFTSTLTPQTRPDPPPSPIFFYYFFHKIFNSSSTSTLNPHSNPTPPPPKKKKNWGWGIFTKTSLLRSHLP